MRSYTITNSFSPRECPNCGRQGRDLQAVLNDVKGHTHFSSIICKKCGTAWDAIEDEFGSTCLKDTIKDRSDLLDKS